MHFDEDDIADVLEGLPWQVLLGLLGLLLLGMGIYYAVTDTSHPRQSTVRVEGIHVRP